MASDLTPDARRRLRDLLSEAVDAVEAREESEVRDGITAARELLESELESDGTPLSDRLFHGCEAVERTVSEDPEVAAEYLRSMEAHVRDETER